jgi:hypothetical protein
MRRFTLLLPLTACAQDYVLKGAAVNVDPEDITECGFTRVETTAFYRYDCNPVFTTTDEGWADTIGSTTFNVTDVVGHPFYQLWYTGYTDTGDSFPPYAMGYAVSPDGTEFTPNDANPVLDQPAKDAWDYDYMAGNQVVWDAKARRYVMIYQGIAVKGNTDGLGVATSPDGLKWDRYEKNPVYDLGYDRTRKTNYCWPLAITLGEQNGYTGYIAGSNDSDSVCEVYRLNAGSLGEWEPDDTAVLSAGKDGEWDDTGYVGMAIASLGEDRFMFYAGFSDWTRDGNYQIATHSFLGMAQMKDGKWKKQADPIPVNMTEEGQVSAVAATTVATRIHLWITDEYDGVQAVGYFLYDPDKAAEDDAAGDAGGEGDSGADAAGAYEADGRGG